MMRISPLVLMLGLATSTMAVSVQGQRPDDQIAPRSAELVRQGQAALAAGNFIAADDALETALAVDPRNRAAFVTMARVAIKQRLFGQAIRLTNRALTLDPTDRDAITVQGEAMVELGALPRARANLAKLQKICPPGCPQLASLGAAIARGPAMAAAKPIPVKKNN
ncbi:MAG TPA: tetratricopeptide repeat protein [Sphingomicrobium sp.]|nr:tetratricopeptide repeat protein [Sphingomicrobium sp.]